MIFTGIEQDYDSNARVHSSFYHQLEITMEKGIKAKGKMERATFDFEGFGFIKESVFLIVLARVHRVGFKTSLFCRF